MRGAAGVGRGAVPGGRGGRSGRGSAAWGPEERRRGKAELWGSGTAAWCPAVEGRKGGCVEGEAEAAGEAWKEALWRNRRRSVGAGRSGAWVERFVGCISSIILIEMV